MSTPQPVPGAQTAVDWTNLDPKTPHDRILVVGTQKFYVYSGHLSLASEFFQTMFNSDYKEKNEEEIEIKDVDPQGLHTFLKLMHPYNKDVITKDNFPILVEYSHRFLARFAFTMCEDFILANSAALDAINLLEMAFKYNWQKLKEKLAIDLTEASSINNEHCPKNCDGYVWNYCLKCGSTSHNNYEQCCSAEFYLRKCGNCGSIFNSKSSGLLGKSSFLVKNKEKLAALSDEINAFIFKALLNKADK